MIATASPQGEDATGPRSPAEPYEIAWFEQGRAEALLDALAAAHTHALPVSRYAPDALRAAVEAARGSPALRADASARLTRAYLSYARDVTSGALEPSRVAPLIEVEPPRPNSAALLRAAATVGDLRALLASLAPRDAEYDALRAAYAKLSDSIGEADWGGKVAGGRVLRARDADARVPALRDRLARLGHDAGPSPAPNRMDDALAEAVKAFQSEYGLNRDGVVGPATLAALNAGPAFRLGQIAVNLERIRWLNRPLGARRVMVNLPDFTVTLFDGDRILFRERVVIGRDKEQTPEFSDEMEHLVLNPTWFVPRSIATEDLLPRLQKDPTILSQRNMHLSRPDGGPLPLDAASHDWSAYSQASFPYRIRQRPSSSNALGRVKFMFPNHNNIYLHDTPQKNLFDRDRRAYSWGCVRVRNPLLLAELLLAPQMDDPKGFIDRTLARGGERYVNLDAHVPVHITYRTAWVDEAGKLQFRTDVYGRDALALKALRSAGLELPES
ncbi:L,D-transpeptidase family protein [Rubrimonas cliftonensis]|nr:L,D-transpeptidase family protein [Rubrimonas cliftonensis]